MASHSYRWRPRLGERLATPDGPGRVWSLGQEETDKGTTAKGWLVILDAEADDPHRKARFYRTKALNPIYPRDET